jgi:RNA polymerase sigma factor (sigma-70 family)
MISDRQLIEGYRSGQQEALELLVNRYKDDLYRFCCHLSLERQDAEDLFQEVWVRILRKSEKYDPERPFKAWLFQVAINLYRDRYRKWKKLRQRLRLAWTVFIYKDASKRKMNAWLWMLAVIYIPNFIGLLLYLFARRQHYSLSETESESKSIQCPYCGKLI